MEIIERKFLNDNEQTEKPTKNRKINIWILILVISIIIIFIIPVLATLPNIIELYDYSKTGQIGDTIGGITAPFINIAAAILVYMAFKEQVKANNIFMGQDSIKLVLEQLRTLKADKEEFDNNSVELITHIKFGASDQFRILERLDVIEYYLNELRFTQELISKINKVERLSLLIKTRFLYNYQFKSKFNLLLKELNNIQPDSFDPECEFSISIVKHEIEKQMKYFGLTQEK